MGIKKVNCLLGVFAACLMGSSIASVVQVTHKRDFDQYMKPGGQPAVIKFSAEWCGACKGVQKPFADVSEESNMGGVSFVDVNIDAHQDIAKERGVIGIPTFLYVENGEVKDQVIGVKDISRFKEQLRAAVYKHFNIAPDIESNSPRIAVDVDVVVDKEISNTAKEAVQNLPDEPPVERPGLLQRIWQAILGVFAAIGRAIRNLFS